MNKMILPAILLFSATLSCSGNKTTDAVGQTSDTSDSTCLTRTEAVAEPVVDPKVKALFDAYPDFIKDINDNTVTFTDGTTMTFDDGREKDFDTKLDYSDPEDMFFVAYRSDSLPPAYLADAGRSRCEPLFKKMYGNSSAEVERKLESVDWFGQKIKFTGVNGAAEQLRKVAAEIAQKPELRNWVKCSGTFYWRKVRGANRQSAHSYGIAIDIAVDKSNYWLWENKGASETTKIKYNNRIPREIVEIFEKYGFIWGGAWYHYDTMHFEYRPEILKYAELVTNVK